MNHKADCPVDTINKELELKFGRDLYNRVRFRLVWSSDQLEKRRGDFVDITESGIIIREDKDRVREVPKYGFSMDTWILEMDVRSSNTMAVPPSLLDWNGYEAIWNFRTEQGVPQTPNVAVVLFIASCVKEGVTKTAKDWFNQEKKEFDKEVEDMFEILDNESPYLATMLDNKEAIVVPSTYKKDV